MLCKVAINLMNTCRVITKDMFTFSTETVWWMGAPDPLALPSFPLPVHQILLEMCTDVAGTANRGHFPPVSSNSLQQGTRGESAGSEQRVGGSWDVTQCRHSCDSGKTVWVSWVMTYHEICDGSPKHVLLLPRSGVC